MSNYIIEGGELKHYGVLGMKWGVRRNPSRAYNRAIKKRNAMEDKRVNLQVKADKKLLKASKKLAKAYTSAGYANAAKMQVKGQKMAAKASQLAKKERKWDKAIDKAFADMSITKLSEKEIATGKNFIDKLLYGNEQYRVEKNED